MNIATRSVPRTCHTPENFVRGRRQKRRLSPSIRPNQVSYPSPPMSNPPSPPWRSDDIPASSSAQLQAPATTSVPSSASPMPGVAVHPNLAPPFYERVGPPLTTSSFRRPRDLPPLSTVQLPLPSAQAAVVQPLAVAPQDFRQTTTKTGRKSKAHVASACINCKRAHLSCDDNRPCARCVASGKQDTCYDVQHKKRGRPRLRQDSDFKVESVIPEAGPSTATALATSETRAARPIAATRSARADSFRSQRSLRSQGSDTSSGMGTSPIYPYQLPSSATRATFDFPHFPPPPGNAPGFEVPTAYLDLDFTILKANPPYRQIMLGGHDVVGRNLGDIAGPADGESFLTIRNRLRREREAREPAYMAPIMQAGQDVLQSVSEADADRYTQGFHDHTYTWTPTQMAPSGQTFPARVRLAKAGIYFVAVTLPSFRPLDAPPAAYSPEFTRPPLLPALSSHTSETYSAPLSRPASQSTQHTSSFLTHHRSSTSGSSSYPPLPRPATAGQSSRTYPPPFRHPSYQDPSSSHTAPHRPVSPRSSSIPEESRTFPHPSHVALAPSLPATGFQLAPIVSSPGSPSTAPSGDIRRAVEATDSVQEQDHQRLLHRPSISPSEREAADESPPGSPRKRPRRMGIDDVLQ